MKTLDQILASNPSHAQLMRAIDARRNAIVKCLDDARWLADETAELLRSAELDNYDVRNNLMPLIVKAQTLAEKL